MRKIKIFLLSLASSLGAMAADLEVAPGQLESLLGDATIDQKELKLKGAIDARDLAALEKLSPEVETLDLSDVEINALTMPSRKVFGRTLFYDGEIPAYTFFKSGVKHLILPSDVKIIGEGAFAGSDIEELEIPEGVTALADYAFYGCPNLTSVSLPKSLKSLGKGVFGNCIGLKSLDLSGLEIVEIPERAFAGALTLESVALPSGIKKVGREAFSHTSIKALDLSTVAAFDAYALSGMPYLEELTLNPEAEINDGLLMDDTSVVSLTGVPEFIPDYFAANCGSLDTSIASGASSLGRYSFANTMAPEELVLSGTVGEIKQGAFAGLSSIARIDVTALEGNVPVADELSFEGIDPSVIELWVSHDTRDLWENSPGWSLFNIKAEDTTGVDNIESVSDRISISMAGGMVVVESESPVTDIRIYTTDGRVAYVASPNQEKVEINASSLPSGVIIVAASNEEGLSKTVTLMLR